MLRRSLQRRFKSFIMACAISSLGGGLAGAAPRCETTEKWCEHKVATFCENEACSNVRTEGECVPKEKSCEEFWCGNRQCQVSWLISRDVCCVYYPSGNAPEYACSASEISCRGNTTQLTIRPPTLASANIPNK